jgi:hypothetical protein
MCGYLSSADPEEKGVVDVILKLYSLNFILPSFSSLSLPPSIESSLYPNISRHLNQSREELPVVTEGARTLWQHGEPFISGCGALL